MLSAVPPSRIATAEAVSAAADVEAEAVPSSSPGGSMHPTPSPLSPTRAGGDAEDIPSRCGAGCTAPRRGRGRGRGSRRSRGRGRLYRLSHPNVDDGEMSLAVGSDSDTEECGGSGAESGSDEDLTRARKRSRKQATQQAEEVSPLRPARKSAIAARCRIADHAAHYQVDRTAAVASSDDNADAEVPTGAPDANGASCSHPPGRSSSPAQAMDDVMAEPDMPAGTLDGAVPDQRMHEEPSENLLEAIAEYPDRELDRMQRMQQEVGDWPLHDGLPIHTENFGTANFDSLLMGDSSSGEEWGCPQRRVNDNALLSDTSASRSQRRQTRRQVQQANAGDAGAGCSHAAHAYVHVPRTRRRRREPENAQGGPIIDSLPSLPSGRVVSPGPSEVRQAADNGSVDVPNSTAAASAPADVAGAAADISGMAGGADVVKQPEAAGLAVAGDAVDAGGVAAEATEEPQAEAEGDADVDAHAMDCDAPPHAVVVAHTSDPQPTAGVASGPADLCSRDEASVREDSGAALPSVAEAWFGAPVATDAAPAASQHEGSAGELVANPVARSFLLPLPVNR